MCQLEGSGRGPRTTSRYSSPLPARIHPASPWHCKWILSKHFCKKLTSDFMVQQHMNALNGDDYRRGYSPYLSSSVTFDTRTMACLRTCHLFQLFLDQLARLRSCRYVTFLMQPEEYREVWAAYMQSAGKVFFKHNNTQSTRLDFQLVHHLKELHLTKHQIISLASFSIFAQEIVPKKPIEDSDSSSVQYFRKSRLFDLTAPEYIRPSVFRPDLDRPG
jgi:hypothetical protein